ncbi:MAG: hypothetical protein CR968_05540 [Flavobacteriia bacterium]|nr:MAG: hypothetical protein CR968_05540 [Flavobacteriia bacterium]
MKTIKWIIYSLSILFIISCSEDKIDFIQTGTITGRVVEANTFVPLANSKVTISPTNNSVFTDEDGYFTMEEVPAGDYSISAEKEDYLAGFEPISVTGDASVNVIFELELSDALNKAPLAPTLLSPEDETTGLPLEVELVWSKAVDPDDDELIYGVIIRNDQNDDTLTFEEISDTIFTINNLDYGVKYFWQVSVNDGFHEDVLTTVNTFETTFFPNNRYYYVKNAGGNYVIYSSDGVQDGADEEVVLTSNAFNSWRPRKNPAIGLIAYLRTEDSETHIFTMKPNGADVYQVTNDVPLKGFRENELDFSWSSDGSQLIYPNFDKLYKINKDGTGLEMIYQTTDGNYITECDWSYDGSMIALKTNNIDGYNTSIFTIDMDGNILDTIVQNGVGGYGGINISIENTYLLYSHDVSEFEAENYRQLDSRIFLYNFNDQTSTDLSEDKEDGTNDLDPRFSPDEAHIIFVNTSNDGVSTNYIYKAELDGNDREQLFAGANMPDWE